MDKFDRFLDDVTTKTAEDSLVWKIASPMKYQEFIFNAPFAYQAFETQYNPAGAKAYQLVFVEKKSPSADDVLDIPGEVYDCELLVIERGTLVFTLNRNYVDADNLFRLASLLESKNTSAKELFSHFE